MSKKSDNFAARVAALGLKVIRNLAPVNYTANDPPSRSRSVCVYAGVPDAADYPRVKAGQARKFNIASVDGDCESIEVTTSTLAKWLEEQYHANLAPFHFLSDIALTVEEMPDEAIVEAATALLRRRGWQIDVHYFNKAGRRVGSVTMMHPESVGF